MIGGFIGKAIGEAFGVGDQGVTSTLEMRKPVDYALAGQQTVPGDPNGVSRALLRSIFRE